MSNLLLRRRMMMQAGGSPTPPTPPEGAIPFPFSVSATKQVYFSKGNLQWSATGGGTTPTTHITADGVGEGTWRFAENQWDFVGNNNSGNVYGVGGDMTIKCNNNILASDYQGWIDLFGWGTSGYDNTANDQWAVNYHPYDYASTNTGAASGWLNSTGFGPSKNMADPNLIGTSANYDWGVYNAISNGGNQIGLWRVMTYAEAQYILTDRTNASQLVAVATVNNVGGFIVLSDDFILPSGISINIGIPTAKNWGNNVYTISEWEQLEDAGAVFIPASSRSNKNTSPYYDIGYFYGWTSTNYSHSEAYYFGARMASYGYSKIYNRYIGLPVRLVHDIN